MLSVTTPVKVCLGGGTASAAAATKANIKNGRASTRRDRKGAGFNTWDPVSIPSRAREEAVLMPNEGAGFNTNC